jgi:hypothetical protein
MVFVNDINRVYETMVLQFLPIKMIGNLASLTIKTEQFPADHCSLIYFVP